MAARKFFYGDKVIFKNLDAHYDHNGVISQTEIHKPLEGKGGYIMYVVNCECGKRLKVRANQIEQNFEVRKSLGNVSDVVPVGSRISFFLESMGIDKNKPIDDVLLPLNEQERTVLEKRNALVDDENAYGHTLEMIGREYGVSKQRIGQIEERAMAKVINANKR